MENPKLIKKPKISIIDVDGLFYHSCKDTIEESIQIFKEKFQNILDKTQCTHYVGFYSNGRYFRHSIDPKYKDNRKRSTPPLWLKALKNWAIIEYNFQYMNKVEADDLCVYWMNKDIVITEDNYIDSKDIIDSANEQLINIDKVTYQIFEKVLSSPDKDLLQSVVGYHFNYTYKLTEEAKQGLFANVNYNIIDEDVIKGWWIDTDKKQSEEFEKMQMIVGDSADNIKGIEGKGIKYWEKLFTSKLTWNDILYEYTSKYGLSQGIYNFQKNYRLLHMLNCDEDFIREIDEIPDIPAILKVIKDIDDTLTF